MPRSGPPLNLAVRPHAADSGVATTWPPHPPDRALAVAVLAVHRRSHGTVRLRWAMTCAGAEVYRYALPRP